MIWCLNSKCCMAHCCGSPAIGQNVIFLLYCFRDADETKEWIEEKNQALNTDNYGHDLASVQALQRKHEGFERDLAALGDKVRGSPDHCQPEGEEASNT